MEELKQIKESIYQLGFHVQEIPIRKGMEIDKWRLNARKNQQTFSVEAKTLDAAFKNLGLILGVRKPVHNKE